MILTLVAVSYAPELSLVDSLGMFVEAETLLEKLGAALILAPPKLQ